MYHKLSLPLAPQMTRKMLTVVSIIHPDQVFFYLLDLAVSLNFNIPSLFSLPQTTFHVGYDNGGNF